MDTIESVLFVCFSSPARVALCVCVFFVVLLYIFIWVKCAPRRRHAERTYTDTHTHRRRYAIELITRIVRVRVHGTERKQHSPVRTTGVRSLCTWNFSAVRQIVCIVCVISRCVCVTSTGEFAVFANGRPEQHAKQLCSP